MRNKIIIGCLLLGALSAKAQDIRLSAVEYKERVLEYSRQIKQSSEERIAMQHAIKAAKTGFFPSVDFSGSYQYRINKYDFPYDVVRSRLEKIDFHTMEYVLECLRNNTTKVRNIRSYMLTTLYNAPVTCSNYYKAEVNHDFYGK